MRLVDGVKTVENALFVLFGNADARIPHREAGALAPLQDHFERTAFFIVADAVADEVVQNLHKPLAAGHDSHVLGDVEL